MPRNTREWARRKLDESVQNLSWGEHHLMGIVEVYEERHPEIATPLVQCVQFIEAIKGQIEKIKASF